MGQSCKICNDSRRISLDREICEGKNIKNLAKSYNVPYHSLYYHAQNHIHRQLATAMQSKELTESFDLLHKIDKILSRTEKIFQRNFNQGKDGLALKALRESRGTLELLAKISVFMHEARATELKNTKTTFSVVVGADDEETSIFDRAADMLSSAEFAELIRLTDKIQNGNDQTEEYAYHEDPDPYPGIPQDLTVDPRPLKSTPVTEEKPKSTMKRTKKPQPQSVKQMDAQQIPGPSSSYEAMISRKKSGIAYLK
jgi:hypothetical protein